MNTKAVLTYYSRQCVLRMNEIEDKTGRLLSDLNPTLERDLFNALDARNLNKVRVLYNELCKAVDSLDGEIGL